jgi:hypothetical protein
MRRKKQSGQAIVMVVVFVGLVLMGSLGLAIDSGQLYGHRQMAQVAADAAAEAGIISIFGHTNSTTYNNVLNGTAFTCTNGSDTRSPCAYARLNGFGLSGSTDTVSVDFPDPSSPVLTGVSGLTTHFTPNAVHVLITRNVGTTFLRLFGASATSSIKAAGTAAILNVVNPVPIIVLHPTLFHAFETGGSGGITVCGGPQQSIQVNSRHSTEATSVSGNNKIDLSHAGPLDDGFCNTGTGSDFGTFGGPSAQPGGIQLGNSKSHYYQPSLPINDPFADVAAPSKPLIDRDCSTTTCGVGTPPVSVPIGLTATGDCPSSTALAPLTGPTGGDTSVTTCTIYLPGNYPKGIQVQGTLAIFNPGVYFIDGVPASGKPGFASGSHGHLMMCKTACVPDTSGNFNENGMLVYLDSDGGNLDAGSNGSLHLTGSDEAGAYKGLLFFGSRGAAGQTGANGTNAHSLGGGSEMGLSGSIYLTNSGLSGCYLGTETVPNFKVPGTELGCDRYQTLSLSGNSGSSTTLKGQIVVSVLQLKGGGSITMDLSADSILGVDQVALVN